MSNLSTAARVAFLFASIAPAVTGIGCVTTGDPGALDKADDSGVIDIDQEVNVEDDENCPLLISGEALGRVDVTDEPVQGSIMLNYTGADSDCRQLALTPEIVSGDRWSMDTTIDYGVLTPGGTKSISFQLDASTPASLVGTMKVVDEEQDTDGNISFSGIEVTLTANVVEPGNGGDDGGGGDTTWLVDNDGDGYGDPEIDPDGDGNPGITTSDGQPDPGDWPGVEGFATNGGDCDDTESSVSPVGVEVCDGLDNDCDGTVDDGLDRDWFEDLDNDGYGTDSSLVVDCASPGADYVNNGGDCDDVEPTVNPAAPEVCDGLDNDCDGLTDAVDPSVLDAYNWYPDDDGDGYGDSSASATVSCDQPTGMVDNDSDCDDDPSTGSEVHPGADEICNSIDDDCDGAVDDADVGIADATTWYSDFDGDGYGDPDASLDACEQPSNYIEDDSDCDDGNSDIYPGAEEYCDLVDNDCDGDVDENSGTISGTIDAADGTCYAPDGSEAGTTWTHDLNSCNYGYVTCTDSAAEITVSDGQLAFETTDCLFADENSAWRDSGDGEDSDGAVCFMIYLDSYPTSALPMDEEEAYCWYSDSSWQHWDEVCDSGDTGDTGL